ncbi:MAG: MFS transporter [Spiribacter salinus]|jgi:PPP family 3-phenylpropionic acid transporter|uniref:MFS transporter n=1 Tax=Spiribacter salinus TaxID=1335746 RepID=A0A540VVK9_9GAMM|nr:MAG: MFS transporter [Spiribacter salinus]
MPLGLPYTRLAAFYFAFFGVLGVLSPYWGPYLRGRGFDAAEIGILVALLHATKIIAPNLWGWVADHTGQRMGVIRLACLVALVAFTGVLLPGGFLWMALVMVGFSFFWNAALPQFEANTLRHLGEHTDFYPRIRLWGTVGFMVAVLVVGEGIDRYGTDIVPTVLLALFLILATVSLTVPQAAPRAHDHAGGHLLGVLRQPRVIGLLLACFFLQASHGPFYALYSIYLQDYGYSGSAIGGLWAIALIAEIGVFLLMPRWLPRFGHRHLLALAMGLGVLRWILVGAFPALMPVQALAQLMHAATYGVYHAAAISLIDQYFTGGLQGRGQALYSSMTFGAGVALGSLVSGWLWEGIGPAQTFYVAAGVASLALITILLSVPRRTAVAPAAA